MSLNLVFRIVAELQLISWLTYFVWWNKVSKKKSHFCDFTMLKWAAPILISHHDFKVRLSARREMEWNGNQYTQSGYFFNFKLNRMNCWMSPSKFLLLAEKTSMDCFTDLTMTSKSGWLQERKMECIRNQCIQSGNSFDFQLNSMNYWMNQSKFLQFLSRELVWNMKRVWIVSQMLYSHHDSRIRLNARREIE